MACKTIWSRSIEKPLIQHLYIHIPFCQQKCHYCGFFSVKLNDQYFYSFFNSLKDELKYYLNLYELKPVTIYIGGGNPSLNYELIKNVLETIKSCITLSCMIEYTIECNPVNLNQEMVDCFILSGVNRISLGVQSFTEDAYRSANRIGRPENDIYNALNMLSKKDFYISIDLINKLPNADKKTDMNGLKSVLKKYPSINHVSLYDLTIDQGSRYHELKRSVEYDDEYEAGMISILKECGFIRYEISNYCTNDGESLHNLAYWKYKNYLGLGPSAHSTIGNIRIENHPSITDYSDKALRSDRIVLTQKEQIQEYLLMGLRLLKGFDAEDFKKRFNLNFKELIKNSDDRIVMENGRVRIREEEINFLNSILIDLFETLDKIK